VEVLVTGGLGFIGANLVPRLQQAGYSVRVFDSGLKSVGVRTDGVRGIEGDVRDDDTVIRAVEGVDVVVHLAAAGSVIESIIDPRANFEINAGGTLNVLRAAVAASVERVIFASTGGALIGNATPPVDERSLPKPISPYGASKLTGEAYCHAFSQSYGLKTVALRFANVYGPHSERKGGAVTAFIKAIADGEPIKIFGDGSASRDYLYVGDLCRGITAAIQSPDLVPGEVLHLASGVETTVSELAREIVRASGKDDHPIVHLDARAGEVERNFASYAYAQKRLGFYPEVSLREGLKQTWEWFQPVLAAQAAA
jgi:UDP-glucose 4-epimerase